MNRFPPRAVRASRTPVRSHAWAPSLRRAHRALARWRSALRAQRPFVPRSFCKRRLFRKRAAPCSRSSAQRRGCIGRGVQTGRVASHDRCARCWMRLHAAVAVCRGFVPRCLLCEPAAAHACAHAPPAGERQSRGSRGRKPESAATLGHAHSQLAVFSRPAHARPGRDAVVNRRRRALCVREAACGAGRKRNVQRERGAVCAVLGVMRSPGRDVLHCLFAGVQDVEVRGRWRRRV